jgi:DNA-binding GntR family transcriptional regulator
MADFHAAIVRGSKNKQLINLLCTELWGLLRISRVQAANEINPAEAALREHRAIVEAMRQRNADLAALLMGRHIRKARSSLLRNEARAPPIGNSGDIEDPAIGEIHLGPIVD